MKKLSILVAILLLSSELAMAEGLPVRVRSDGYVINEDGKIIAIPNPSDERNDKYSKYYKSLGQDGKPIENSDFVLIADPKKGYVRYPVDQVPPNPDTIDKISANKTQPTQTQPQNGMVTNYGSTQILQKSPDAPIYDHYSAPRSVY
jgi:hypothetical protein